MSHWKEKKAKWAINLFETGSLVCRNGVTALYPTRMQAKATMWHLHPSAYRILRVWIKYEEVKRS